jgi:Bacterial Ig-like domain (group 2)
VQSIRVTTSNLTIAKGLTTQFQAIATLGNGTMEDVSGSVTWASSDTGVVTITSGGLAKGVGVGSATIQAASTGGVVGSAVLQVTIATVASIGVTSANYLIPNGGSEQFAAMGIFTDGSTQDLTTLVTWNSTDMSVATITAGGLATAVGNGMTSIQATQTGLQGSFKLSVMPIVLTVLVVGPQNPVIADGGTTQAFTATAHFNDGGKQDLTASATWTSSNASVATMSGAVATSQTLAVGASAGFSSIQAAVGGATGVAILSVTNHTGNGFAGVFTQHNDNSRTGLNANENVLTTANVGSSATFGKKFAHSVDGYIYAQPLYVPGVSIGGVTHNVVIVSTEGDSVYAFDADNNTGANANPLWHASLIDTAHGATAGEQTVNSHFDLNCIDLIPQVGSTGTPVIDPGAGTVYVEAKSKQPNGPQFFHRLHALDVASGNEKAGGPAVIAGSVPIPGGGSATFVPLNQNNRPGLLWVNGIIYIAYASHCDSTVPYYGWVFAYNAATMSQVAIWNDTLTSTSSNGGLGGIWMSGAGIAADSAANLFLSTGNGEFDNDGESDDDDVPAPELGDSNVRLFYNGNNKLSVLDYFTPFDQLNLEHDDTDLGSGGILLLPDQGGSHPHEFVHAGKDGTIHVIDRDQMTQADEHYCPPTDCSDSDPETVQELVNAIGGMWSSPAYWNNNIYFCGSGDNLAAFTLSNGMLSASPSTHSSHTFQFPGCVPSVSANGTSNAIVWAIDASNYGPPAQKTPGPAVLYALGGDTLALLWNSSQAAGGRDKAGSAVKFSVPTVANGKVYVGTATELDVYGTLP